MRESMQGSVDKYYTDRPIMKGHDTTQRLIGLLDGEMDELFHEVKWGGKEPTPETVEKIRLELADVVIYCTTMASLLGIDIELAVEDKLRINDVKFPKDLFQKGDFNEVYNKRKRELGERE